jgi:hypothetical protein
VENKGIDKETKELKIVKTGRWIQGKIMRPKKKIRHKEQYKFEKHKGQ